MEVSTDSLDTWAWEQVIVSKPKKAEGSLGGIDSLDSSGRGSCRGGWSYPTAATGPSSSRSPGYSYCAGNRSLRTSATMG